jgi:hypothetical protein
LTDQTTRGRILVALGQHVAGLTAIELAETLGSHLKTIQNEISRLLQERPPPIVATGSGTKGDPRRYATIAPELFPNDSRNNGNNGEEMVPTFPNPTFGNNGNHFRKGDDAGTGGDDGYPF